MSDLTPTTTQEMPRPAVADVTVTRWSNPDIIARAAVAFAILIGVLSLVGWLVDVPELRALGPSDRAAMNPMASACFIAIGCAMWLVAHEEVRHGRDIARAIAALSWLSA